MRKGQTKANAMNRKISRCETDALYIVENIMKRSRASNQLIGQIQDSLERIVAREKDAQKTPYRPKPGKTTRPSGNF